MSKRLAMPNEGREVTKTPGHWYSLNWVRKYCDLVAKS